MLREHGLEDSVRLVPLDGALLAFDRRDGRRWLLRGDATRALRSHAPPLVLFGLSNACNLACSFCYRDASARTVWTADTAFSLLSSLASLGTLEVAFGGGEPFAFASFCALVARLADETPLAIHATTNGALFTADKARALRGKLRELRISVYDDAPWERALENALAHEHSVGLHWLATPERLPSLRSFALRAARLGARKLFFLSYNGPDPSLHLSRDEQETLAHEIKSLGDLGLELGISACWGDRLEAMPTLSPDRGADCGAGASFVSISADGTLSPCSFHHQRRAVRSVEDVLEAYEAMRSPGPARVRGCHRSLTRPAAQDGLWRWRAWSGNNSVDCFTIGRFASATAADDAVAELRALLAAGPQRTLMQQAYDALGAIDQARFPLFQASMANPTDRQAWAALDAAEQQARQEWLEEVAAWEQEPARLAQYAGELGAGDRVAELPAELEAPDALVGFGTNAIHSQGTTLAPFRALDWLWVYRGARVPDLRRGYTRGRESVVWAAKAASESEARSLAPELGAVVRGASLWGALAVRQWERQPGGGFSGLALVALRERLEARGLRFDGEVLVDWDLGPERIEREVMALRPRAPEISARLLIGGVGERFDEAMQEFSALDADPSRLWDWTRGRIEGSRRWPSDLAMHRWDGLTMIEASQLPQSIGRGFLLRGTSMAWSLDARDVLVTARLGDDSPVDRARQQLRSLGFEPVESESVPAGTVVTTTPSVAINRLAELSNRQQNRWWDATLRPANPLRAALENLQSRLDLRFAK
jgi:hypothetical protein